MKKLIFIGILLYSLTSLAQVSQTKEVIQPETSIIASGNSQFRVITSNITVFNILYKENSNIINKIVQIPKNDRLGEYWEYSLYFDNTQYELVKAKIVNLKL